MKKYFLLSFFAVLTITNSASAWIWCDTYGPDGAISTNGIDCQDGTGCHLFLDSNYDVCEDTFGAAESLYFVQVANNACGGRAPVANIVNETSYVCPGNKPSVKVPGGVVQIIEVVTPQGMSITDNAEMEKHLLGSFAAIKNSTSKK